MHQLSGRPSQRPAGRRALCLLLDLPITPLTFASTAVTAAVAATAPTALAAAAAALAAPVASTSVLAASASALLTATPTALATTASAGTAGRKSCPKRRRVLDTHRRGPGELGRVRRGDARGGARVPELLRRHWCCRVHRRRRLLRGVHCRGPRK